jgi:hypothetical protein
MKDSASKNLCMKISILLSIFIGWFYPHSNAMQASDSSAPRFRATVYTMNDNKIQGLLLYKGEEEIRIYPGTWKNWSHKEITADVTIPAGNIRRIELKKKNGALKGILIGTVVGIIPVIVSSIFGHGEGGAYVSLITLPLGIITGTIIGLTSKRKYNINGSRDRFAEFQRK